MAGLISFACLDGQHQLQNQSFVYCWQALELVHVRGDKQVVHLCVPG